MTHVSFVEKKNKENLQQPLDFQVFKGNQKLRFDHARCAKREKKVQKNVERSLGITSMGKRTVLIT